MSVSQGVPSQTIPFVDDEGRISQPWFRYLQTLVNQPPAAQTLSTIDLVSYTANKAGVIYIDTVGTITGTVSRGTISVPVTVNLHAALPVGQGDVVALSFTDPITAAFFPS